MRRGGDDESAYYAGNTAEEVLDASLCWLPMPRPNALVSPIQLRSCGHPSASVEAVRWDSATRCYPQKPVLKDGKKHPLMCVVSRPRTPLSTSDPQSTRRAPMVQRTVPLTTVVHWSA